MEKKNLEINIHIYEQLIFNKIAKTIQWRNDSLFIWNNWLSYAKKKKTKNEQKPHFDPYFATS